MAMRAQTEIAEATWQHAADTAQASSRVYGLLSTVFRHEPTADFLREFKAPEWKVVLDDLGIALGEEFFRQPADRQREDLAVEYTRLFLGPGEHISPHASVHMAEECGFGGLLWGEETVRVKRFIEAAGLAYAEDYSGIPDHVSVELEFLEKLAGRESAAWNEGDHDGAQWCVEVERRFLEDHVLKWVPTFCDKVMERAVTPFYAAMAELTKELLAFERERLSGYATQRT